MGAERQPLEQPETLQMLRDSSRNNESSERQPATHSEVLGAWVGSFVDELVACGLRDVCLCPGSRSTPLAIAFARHPDVKVWTHLDERSCAYFALGMAKAGGYTSPVAILCSSGTAAVNFAPAVVEAFHSRVPLIVLTADRPPELQDLGANQTIDQHRLYGPAVKWFSQLPLPEASPEMLRYVRMIAARAADTAREQPAGPVHLDFPFREPLVPAPYAWTSDGQSARLVPSATPFAGALDAIADELRAANRPLIVAGPNARLMGDAAVKLAEAIASPILADPLSELRTTPFAGDHVLGAYDSFLRVPALTNELAPNLILRFGDPPTSKPLATYLAKHRAGKQVVVTDGAPWPDPDLTGDLVIHADSAAFCEAMLEAVRAGEPVLPSNGWLGAWQEAERATLEVYQRLLSDDGAPTEPSSIADLAALLPEGAAIFAGNSMPVRDVDSFFPVSKRLGFIYGSRGASGIDGVVSTALGVAARSDAPTVLVIGDLSFYHDMNGLLAAQRHNLSATIVLINNDGGGIFSFLPQHEQSEDFETLFGTPHGLDFSHVGPLYGVGFQRVETRKAYRDALNASVEAPGVQVIEVRTDREENLRLHQRIWAAVAEAVTPLVTNGARP